MLYTLMHREQPVAVLDMNPTNGSINGVREVLAAEHLPIQVRHDNLSIAADLDKWFSGRAIPASRSGFRQNLEDLELQRGIELSSGKLLMECYGLSLSDQYWVSPVDAPLNWKKINFYDNPFSEDVGNFLFGQIVERGILDLVSPCNTSDGWLKKKWKIIDGQRILIKGGSGVFSQEPFNEAVASAICRRLNIPHIEYSLLWENGVPYSACPNMTNNRQDLVSAFSIYSSGKKPNHLSPFDYFIACCEQLGIPGVRRFLSQMLVLDFLICNQDRHFGNFGAIRDAVTLEWLGMAPVYDSGTSLWLDKLTPDIHPRADAAAKPFRNTHGKQLELVANDLEWLDFSSLQGLQEEIYNIYEKAHFGEPNRAAVLSQAVTTRCELLQDRIREFTPQKVSIQDICQNATARAKEINTQHSKTEEATPKRIEPEI